MKESNIEDDFNIQNLEEKPLLHDKLSKSSKTKQKMIIAFIITTLFLIGVFIFMVILLNIKKYEIFEYSNK